VYHIATTEPMTCSCKGRARGLVCWHITAARLIVRAAEHHAQQPASPKAGIWYKGFYYSAESLEASRTAREAAIDELVA